MTTSVPRSAGLPRLSLVLGGVRSGKSRHAEQLVLKSGLEPIYVATAEAMDDEMAHRIALHRRRRGARWRTVEEPLWLTATLARECAPGRAVLVDCLTLWLTNCMVAGREVSSEIAGLVDVVRRAGGPLVLVSNEVGAGVMPTNAMARGFADHAGVLHQELAGIADAVTLMVAGLPLSVKTPAVDVPGGERRCTS